MGKRRRKKPLSADRAPLAAETEPRTAESGKRTAISIALAVLVLAVFSPVVTHDFINYDDPDYVASNAIVQRGVTIEGIRYAFTALRPYYWEPLTWLSLELDCSIAGNRPAVHLIVNVLLHAAAVVLLFLLLQQTTAATWPSAFAAAIWGVHPLRVESVAWIAERKDVLSTLLFIATIFWYARRRYALVLITFILALMAKPMVVMLPLVLLLFDIWPLGRRPRIADKIPLAVLATAIVAITFFGQRGAIASALPIGLRTSNAIVSTVAYLGKIFVPIRLAVLYPYSYSIPAWTVLSAAIVIVAITAGALWLRKTRPYVTVGWLWYLVTLVPVIGIVQAGPQSMADRFTYIPSIGITFAVVWSLRRMAPLGVAAAIALSVLSVYNLRFWRNSVTLFTHAIDVTRDNALAHVKIGEVLLARNRFDEANAHFAEAVQVSRGGSLPLTEAGAAFIQQKRYAEAIDVLQRAVAADPNMAAARENLAFALMNSGRPAEAVEQFDVALRLDDGSRRAEVLQGRGDAKRFAGRIDEGIVDLRDSIDLKSTPGVWNDLGSAYSAKNDIAAAEQAYTQALLLDPNLYDARMNYAAVLNRAGQNEEAAAQIRQAMRLNPSSVEPRVYLALVTASLGRRAEAVAIAEEAKRMDARASNEFLTRALRLQPKPGNYDEFIATLRR